MDVRTIKLTWEELDGIFERIFMELLNKKIKCETDCDDYSYWGVKFCDAELNVEEVEAVCSAVNANEEERKEAFPCDEDESSRDFGMSIASKLLSRHLGCVWKKVFADDDALYLIECQ